jgi:hypothetical protein
MEPSNQIERVLHSGAVIWACVLTSLVLVGAILSSTFGMSSGVLIFLVTCAVGMGLSGLLLLRRYFG